MNVAFFGGSFDPPHVAHVLAAAYLHSVGQFDRILIVPVYEHAFKKSNASFEQRIAMCELALGFLPKVEVSQIERRLGQPSFTLRTLQQLQNEHPDWSLRLVIGSDVLFETHKWHAFDEVAALAPPFVLGRHGSPHPRAPAAILPEVSSSQVRALVARFDSRKAAEEVGRLVPAAVLDYMSSHGLYR